MYKPTKQNTKPKGCDYLKKYPIVRKDSKHQTVLHNERNVIITSSGMPKALDGQLTIQSAMQDLNWIVGKFNKKKSGVMMPKTSGPFK